MGVPVDQDEGAKQAQPAELEELVVYAMLMPSIQLAHRFRMPLKHLGERLEMGYYHELRKRGYKMREASELLQVSMRKVAQLSKLLKDNFFEPTRGHSLSRRIEFMVWAEPLSVARIQQAIPDVEEDEILQTIEEMLEDQRLVEHKGRTTTYGVARGARRLVRDHWISRMDGLNQFLSTITHTIYARFFEDDANALVRNLQLRIRPQDMDELHKLYESSVWETLSRLDEQARDAEDAIEVEFVIGWVPRKDEPED